MMKWDEEFDLISIGSGAGGIVLAATGLGRLASTKRVVHVADLKAEQAYLDRDPLRVATVDGAGARQSGSVVLACVSFLRLWP
jgi:choline dehydrogenase-like flavoprotein